MLRAAFHHRLVAAVAVIALAIGGLGAVAIAVTAAPAKHATVERSRRRAAATTRSHRTPAATRPSPHRTPAPHPSARRLSRTPSPRLSASRTRATASPSPRLTPIVTAADVEVLAARLAPPIAGLATAQLHDTFAEARGGRRHEATDIVAARGTPVLAVDDGVVVKLFTSVPGGLTIYQLSADGAWCFYYAHLDGYAAGVTEGLSVHRSDMLGYVGTTGNAGATAHLHLAILKRDPETRWWEGTPIDPYPLLRRALAR